MKLRVTIWLLFISIFAWAQPFDKYKFNYKVLNTTHGLPSDGVIKCQEDSRGFLWIITENGLSRYDGFTFKNFQSYSKDSVGIPHNELLDIAIDQDDNLWLSSSRGLIFFNSLTFKSFFIYKNNKILLSQKVVCDIKAKQLYSTDLATGLSIIHTTNKKLIKNSLETTFPNIIKGLYLDSKKTLWIAIDRRSIYKYHTPTNTFENVPVNFWPMNFIEKNDQEIYVSTWGGGLMLFDKNDLKNPKIQVGLPMDKEGFQYPIFEELTTNTKLFGDSILILSTQTNGYVLYNKKTEKFIKNIIENRINEYGFTSDFLHHIYTTKDGNTWFSTWNDGLVLLSKEGQAIQKEKWQELNLNLYNCISSIKDDPNDKQIAWMSVVGTGIAKINKNTNKIIQWFYKESDPIKGDFNYDKRWAQSFHQINNTLYSVSYGGLIKVENGKVNFIDVLPGGRNVYYFNAYQSKKNKIWLIGDSYTLFDPTNNTFTDYPFPKNEMKYNFLYPLNDLVETNNTVYCGTEYGFYSLDTIKKTYQEVTLKKFANNTSKAIYALAEKNGIVYIATSHGLIIYNTITGEESQMNNELDDAAVGRYSLFIDRKNNLWVQCNKGVYCYKISDKSLLKFDKNDGIYKHGNDNAYFFEYDSSIFIGHRMAYTRINPTIQNHSIPQTYITDLIYGNGKKTFNCLNIKQTLSFYSNESNIRVNFTAIDFNSSDFLFSTYLEGFDKEWTSFGSERFRSFSYLDPGTYTFYFRVIRKDGNPYKPINTAQFTFEVKPLFYQTWYFKFLLILISGGIILSIYKFRVNTIRKQAEEKTAVNKKMAELDEKLLRSQMNPHFIFNSLNSIQKYIWNSNEEDAAEYLSKFAKLMRSILENSRLEMVSLMEEIRVLKLYVELEHSRTNGKFDFEFIIDPGIDKENAVVPPLILQPFVENAIWHGLSKKEERGKLSIRITKEDEKLICIVEDDGVGRSHSTQSVHQDKKSFGVNISKQRIERLILVSKKHAELHIIDKKDENNLPTGTKVLVVLPYTLINPSQMQT